MGPIWSVVHLTLEQLCARTLTLPVVEISHLTLLSPYLQFCVPDSTNHRLCGSTVLFSGKKKNPCISGPMQIKLMLFKGQLYTQIKSNFYIFLIPSTLFFNTEHIYFAYFSIDDFINYLTRYDLKKNSFFLLPCNLRYVTELLFKN